MVAFKCNDLRPLMQKFLKAVDFGTRAIASLRFLTRSGFCVELQTSAARRRHTAGARKIEKRAAETSGPHPPETRTNTNEVINEHQ